MIGHLLAGGRLAAPTRRSSCAAAIAALLALLLAACAPPGDHGRQVASAAALRGPPGSAAAVRFTDTAFIAADGASLPLRKWLPKGPVKAVILALHGFNDYSNAFAIPAAAWAERGIATFAYDQRGFGGAPGRRLWAGGAQLAADAVTATAILRRLYPGRPLYLLGESMGGAVATLAMTGADGRPRADADGVVLSAPAVWGRATMDLLPRLTLWAGVRLFPEMVLTGRGLGIKPSDNLPMLRALAADPMVLKGSRVDTVYGLVDLMDAALAAAPRLDAPLLLMYGAHDEVVPREPLAVFTAALPPDPARRRRLAYYADGYHLLMRDLEAATVAADIASWIIDRQAPLPSRADRVETAQPWPPRRGGGAG
jgi:acylglycerol lipase